MEWTEAALRPAHSLPPPTRFFVANPLLHIPHPLLLCRFRFIITIQDHLLVLNNGYQFIIKTLLTRKAELYKARLLLTYEMKVTCNQEEPLPLFTVSSSKLGCLWTV